MASHDQQIQAYRKLLDDAAPILERMRSEEERRPPTFNLFLILGHAYREVSTHSAMLAHLLDPAGGHGQGPLYLRAFLTTVQNAALRQGKELILPQFDAAQVWRCRKEVPLPSGFGQADILLRGPQLIMVIENKIHSQDSDTQIPRYWKFVSSEAQHYKRSPLLVYLTPDGRPPSPRPIASYPGLAERTVQLSYRSDISGFIEGTIGATRAVAVEEVLRQYEALARRLI